MTLVSDIAGDWAYIDGVEDVTHTSRPAGTETASVKALRRPRSLGHRSSESFAVDPDTIVWHLWSTTLTVRPGDLITDGDSEAWIIESCERTTLNTRWRCVCRKGTA